MPGSRFDIGGVRGNRLVRWGERRLERHSSGRLGSLALGWLQRYAESSEYSAAALVLGTFLSMVPALLAVYALADLSAGSGNGIAQHLSYRLHIHQPAVALVVSAFGSEASNAAAASVVGLLGFLIFGLGLGKIVQDVYARAWRIRVGSPADRWRFAVWFIVSTILLGLQVTEESVVSALGWVLVSPIWIRRPCRLLALDAVVPAPPPDRAVPVASWRLAGHGDLHGRDDRLGVLTRLLGHRQRAPLRLLRHRPRPAGMGPGLGRDLVDVRHLLTRLRRLA